MPPKNVLFFSRQRLNTPTMTDDSSSAHIQNAVQKVLDVSCQDKKLKDVSASSKSWQKNLSEIIILLISAVSTSKLFVILTDGLTRALQGVQALKISRNLIR